MGLLNDDSGHSQRQPALHLRDRRQCGRVLKSYGDGSAILCKRAVLQFAASGLAVFDLGKLLSPGRNVL
ncbi:hypothetical protein B5V01_28510 [Mesorhizobium erdmanii]|uniref:Uncharacterized protein n=2 Tax=Mesorhizobium TaxID=68287 RepID=A0A3M9X4I7_9HYPH|nr:hypothetical protein DNR46_28545 [Mesorhizobium japonicum]RXT37376.1 hypothetical protein B5V01_28510 [Mesorhizobium erdmanii]